MAKALAAGEKQTEFYAQTGETDIVTDGTTWHPVTIPAYHQCRRLVIQCQKETPTFDVDTDMTSFRVSSSNTGPGMQFTSAGVSLPRAFDLKDVATTVYYVQAPVGFKILVCLLA